VPSHSATLHSNSLGGDLRSACILLSRSEVQLHSTNERGTGTHPEQWTFDVAPFRQSSIEASVNEMIARQFSCPSRRLRRPTHGFYRVVSYPLRITGAIFDWTLAMTVHNVHTIKDIDYYDEVYWIVEGLAITCFWTFYSTMWNYWILRILLTVHSKNGFQTCGGIP